MIHALFYVMLTEVVLGGGGRTFSFGPVTLRMLLFLACIAIWLGTALASTKRRDGQTLAFLLVAGFCFSLTPGLLVDAKNGTEVPTVAAELQPLLFWFLAPFIAMSISSIDTVKRSSLIIVYGGILVSIVTTIIMFGLQYGFVRFGNIYAWAARTDEMFFRTNTNFFYKGHFFVGLSVIFCLILRPSWWKTGCAISVISLALSLTRGLYLAVALSAIASLVIARRPLALTLTMLVGLTLAVFYSDAIINTIFDPSRQISTQTRSNDLLYFWYSLDFHNLMLGDGTGALLNGRHGVENSFLWALWRFGILGVAFWLFPFFLCLRYFTKIPINDQNRKLAGAFMCGVIMLYIVTLFNPFINNSVGLVYLICAIFSLRRISKSAPDRAEHKMVSR